jgi:hypothetical protein
MFILPAQIKFTQISSVSKPSLFPRLRYSHFQADLARHERLHLIGSFKYQRTFPHQPPFPPSLILSYFGFYLHAIGLAEVNKGVFSPTGKLYPCTRATLATLEPPILIYLMLFFCYLSPLMCMIYFIQGMEVRADNTRWRFS